MGSMKEHVKVRWMHYLNRQWKTSRALPLLAIFVTVLAVATEAHAHDCASLCVAGVSCGTECLANGGLSTCREQGQADCRFPFGGCTEVCTEQVPCREACNFERDGAATTCGAAGLSCMAEGDGNGDVPPPTNGDPPPPPNGDPPPPPNGTADGGVGTLLVNLAFRRPTEQSSTDFGGLSSRAVDSVTNGDFFSSFSSVTHTEQQDNPHWRVSICPGQIETIQIFNRTDCCSDRLSGAKVFIRRHDTEQFTPVLTLGALPLHTVSVGRGRGDYVEVLILLEGQARILSLAEVMVWGLPFTQC